MSFIPLINIANLKDNKDGPRVGKVINNNDPKKLGRIKVELAGIFDSTDSTGSNLPWVRRLNDTFLCGAGQEFFSVPPIGSYVQVIWPFGDDIACYRGLPYGKQNMTNSFTEEYPNAWGIANNNGFIFKVNDIDGTVMLKTNTAQILIDSKGNITISGEEIAITGNTITLTSENKNTKIDGIEFLTHQHTDGNEGNPTGGVIQTSNK